MSHTDKENPSRGFTSHYKRPTQDDLRDKSFDLDTPVLQLPDGVDGRHTYSWTIRNAVEGLQIFGGIGSGKTSGSGRMVALKYLSMGFGGIVLTAKTDEKAHWQELCKIAGRTDDLIVIEPGGQHFFNLMEHLAAGGEQKEIGRAHV